MKKTPLEMYLTKVSLGDASYLNKLHAQIADRLCYVPVLSVKEDAGLTAKVLAVSLQSDAGKQVVMFTSEEKLHKWGSGSTVDFIEVLGADLCATLGDKGGVLVDPGADNSVTLSLDSVQQIAHATSEPETEKTEVVGTKLPFFGGVSGGAETNGDTLGTAFNTETVFLPRKEF